MNYIARRNRFVSYCLTTLALCTLQLTLQAQSRLTGTERQLAKSVSVAEIKRITSDLSADRLEGRGTLQRGGDLAASWIAEQMKAIGLKPLGDNGSYLQSVPFVETVVDDSSGVSVEGQRFEYGKDWSAPGLFKDFDLSAQSVFVGQGISSQALRRNDLKDVDLKGKIAVYVDGPPAGEQLSTWEPKTIARVPGLLQRGVIGLLIVANGRELYKRDFVIDMTSRRTISDPVAGKQLLPLPVLFISDALADKLFAGSGVTRTEALERSDSSDFTPIPLKPNVQIKLRSKQTDANAANVVGYFEGSDPVLKNEAVAFTAHYDAFGIMKNKIYNGAADNAIGNGEMLAVAKAFSKMKVKPKRSLVFISTTAEEYGLLGGRYYAQHPTWDITKVAADLNLDGIGTEIMGKVRNMVGYGAELSALGPIFDDVAKAYGITAMDDPIPEQKVFQRSDHYAFVERGVPALMLVGSPVGTTNGFVKVFEEFENSKYHQPSDDVYKNWYWPGAKTVADIMAIIGYRVAQQQEMPSWRTGTPYSTMKRGDKLDSGQ